MSDEPCFQDVIVLTEVSDHFGCHLRIWERGNRTIVVAGQLKNLYVPQSRIEQCVDEIARISLPQAREFEFYTYDPGTLDEYAAELGMPFQAVFFDVACPRRRGTAMTTRIYSAAGHAPERACWRHGVRVQQSALGKIHDARRVPGAYRRECR